MLEDLMRARGVSERELARRVSLSHTAVQKWTAWGAPPPRRVAAVARALDLPADEHERLLAAARERAERDDTDVASDGGGVALP